MAAARTKRKKKPKQKSNRVLLREWSIDVRNRDNNKCVVCGQAEYVNAHHILCKLKYSAYKLERDNGVSLCPRHHKFSKESAHVNAIWFSEWLKANRLELWVRAMQRIGYPPMNLTTGDNLSPEHIEGMNEYFSNQKEGIPIVPLNTEEWETK